MGEGLKRVAKQCGGLVATDAKGNRTEYDGDGNAKPPAQPYCRYCRRLLLPIAKSGAVVRLSANACGNCVDID